MKKNAFFVLLVKVNYMIFNFKKQTTYTDEDLLNLYVSTSDQESLGELYARYIPLVYGLCLKYLQHQQEAEDAVVDIYEDLIDKCKQHEVSNFKSWLYTLSRNYCLQLIRKTKPKFYEEISENIVETEPFMHLIDESDDNEKENALKTCLDTLPKAQLKCIKSFFFEKCSYADIVLMTGYTLNKVKSHIQNGKRNLRTCMIKALNI